MNVEVYYYYTFSFFLFLHGRVLWVWGRDNRNGQRTLNTKVYGFRYFEIFVYIIIFSYRTKEYRRESILRKPTFYKIC